MSLQCQLYNEKCSINLKSVKYKCVNFQFQECIIFIYLYQIKSQVSPIVVAYHFIKHANVFSTVLLHILDQYDTSIKTCYLLTCSLFSAKYFHIVTPLTTAISNISVPCSTDAFIFCQTVLQAMLPNKIFVMAIRKRAHHTKVLLYYYHDLKIIHFKSGTSCFKA